MSHSQSFSQWSTDFVLLRRPGWLASPQFSRIAGQTALAALVWMIVEPAVLGPLKKLADDPARFGDHGINQALSLQVASACDYPSGFTYPPPSVALRVGLHRAFGESAGWIWIACLVACTLACFSLSYRLLGIAADPLRHWVGLLAFLPCRYYTGYDLLAANCNGIALALTLAAVVTLRCRRNFLAGGFLAAAVALKLYPAVLVLLWLWQRRFSSTIWAIAWMLAFFLAVPMAAWGKADARRINSSWRREIRATADPSFASRFVAYVVSLERGVQRLLSGSSEPTEECKATTRIVVDVAQGIWLVAIAAYFVRQGRRATNSGTAMLSDHSVALLAPLPFSPLLQPHHLAPALMAELLFAEVLLSSWREQGGRWSIRGAAPGCLALLVGPIVLLQYGPAGETRGVAVFIHLAMTLGGLLWLRPEISKSTESIVVTERTASARSSLR